MLLPIQADDMKWATEGRSAPGATASAFLLRLDTFGDDGLVHFIRLRAGSDVGSTSQVVGAARCERQTISTSFRIRRKLGLLPMTRRVEPSLRCSMDHLRLRRPPTRSWRPGM